MRYSLRTLLILLAVLPPLLATVWTNGESLQKDIEKDIPKGLTPEAEGRIRSQLKNYWNTACFCSRGRVRILCVDGNSNWVSFQNLAEES